MSTLHRMRVELIEGSRLRCHVDLVSGTHWPLYLASSRTMALQLLWDSLTSSALLAPELDGWGGHEETWNLANLGRFISCVGTVDHQNCDERWDEKWNGPTILEAEERPSATFFIAVTDPRWLAHLTPGMEWDSTAYDHDAEVKFDPAWRTSDVLTLARGIVADQAFDRMPILADALQEAGCDTDDILNHLRDPHATHVRGCWALDLVLGKE